MMRVIPAQSQGEASQEGGKNKRKGLRLDLARHVPETERSAWLELSKWWKEVIR